MPKPIHCILLVDDDPDDIFFHQFVIQESGLCDDVQAAENGTKALQYLANTTHPNYRRPDIIFLDINMPAMNGFEFLERYRELPPEQKSRLVVVMLTTSLNLVDRNRSDRMPEVTGYYSKPLTVPMLQSLVDQHFT